MLKLRLVINVEGWNILVNKMGDEGGWDPSP